MLVHVAVKAKIASQEGVLTYRGEAQVGEMVTVLLRGHRTPGVVVAVDVPAETSQQILPLQGQSGKQLPASYVKTLRLIGDYYGWPLSPTLAQLAAQLNAATVSARPATGQVGPQRVFLTPSTDTPLASYLRQRRASFVGTAAAERNRQWWGTASGESLDFVGTNAALLLPYSRLEEIVLEAPLASPYYQDRAPGFHTAVLAGLVATATGANLTVRSALPLPVLQQRFPFPDTTKITPPTFHNLISRPLGDQPIINKDLLDEIRRQLATDHQVLIYYNHLPHLDPLTGQMMGLSQFATKLAKLLERPVATLTSRSGATDAPIIVATGTTLYSCADRFSQIIVPNADALVSARQPWSPLAAVEALAVLASRAPILIQYRDPDSLIAQACRANLDTAKLANLDWPSFSSRLVRFAPEGESRLTVPATWREIPASTPEAEKVWLTNRALTAADRTTINDARAQGKIWTDEWIWPA